MLPFCKGKYNTDEGEDKKAYLLNTISPHLLKKTSHDFMS